MHPIRAIAFSILFGSLSALTNCAAKPSSQVIDPALLVHVETFEARYGVRYTGDAIISTLSSDKAGICSISPRGKVITINRLYFEKYDVYGLEELMYHELGHCALGLDHKNDKDQYGCPNSIMFYAAFGNSWCYTNRRNMLLQELEDSWKNLHGN